MSFEYMKLPRLYSVRIDPRYWNVIRWQKSKRTTAIKDYCCFPFQASYKVPVGNIVSNGVYLAKNPRLSTIWAFPNGTLGVGFTPPEGVKTAVSGIPLVVEGREFSLTEALAQGWDTSPMYPTSHSILSIGADGHLHYHVFETTSSGVQKTFNELKNIAKQLGYSTSLLGDGGGSTILDVDGVNKVVSGGSRSLAALMTFGR